MYKAPTQTTEPICLNCGTNLIDTYCHKCGVKKYNREDHRFRFFLDDLLQSLTFVDNKFLKSIKVLVLKPGRLTREFLDGKRTSFVRPLQLFLLINVIYFFLQPFTFYNTFNTTLKIQINYLPYSAWATKIVNKKIDDANLSYENYEAIYNQESQSIAKLGIIILVPMFAFLLKLLFLKSKKLYFEHLVFSLHFYAFSLFALYTVFAFLLESITPLFPEMHSEFFGEVVTGHFLNGIKFVYLFVALKLVYEQKWFSIAIKAFILTYVFFPLVQLYRFLLFIPTFLIT